MNKKNNLKLKPFEILTFCFILSLFTFLIVFMSTRQLDLAGIFSGLAFIVSSVFIALIGFGFKENTTMDWEKDKE